MDGPTRPVEDAYTEVISNLPTRPGAPPPLAFDNLLAFEESQPAPRPSPLTAGRDYQPRFTVILPGDLEMTAYLGSHGELLTDKGGSTRLFKDVYHELTDTNQQTVTPNPGASKEQFVDDLLNERFEEENLLAMKELLLTEVEDYITKATYLPPTQREDIEPNVSTLEESITNPSYLPPTPDEDREPNDLASRLLVYTKTSGRPKIFIKPGHTISLVKVSSNLHQNKLRRGSEAQARAQAQGRLGPPLTTTLEESSITNTSSPPQPTPDEDGEPNDLASRVLLYTTTLEESSITNASSPPQPTPREDRAPNGFTSNELLGTTTLEESITNVSSLPQPTSPLKRELITTPHLLQALDKARASFHLWQTQQPSGSGYACHYLALHGPDMLSAKYLSIVTATLGKSSIMDASSTCAEAVTPRTPPISARKPAGWNHQFFIREDCDEVFHTYPALSGPFRSLEEAEKAILRRLDELRDPKMCTNNGLSRSEIAIQRALYWPDGTRKRSSRSNPDEDNMVYLVQALLDKYNEKNDLLADRAYQVQDVVSFQEVYEGDGGWYYHLNCTIKTKDGVGNLFFAEVLKMIRGGLDEFELTCLHMVESVDNGTCYGCTNADIAMKHPIDAGKYKGGHDPSWPRGSGCYPRRVLPKDMHARTKYEEERIRYIYRDRGVTKSDAGTRTDAGSKKYLAPARR